MRISRSSRVLLIGAVAGAASIGSLASASIWISSFSSAVFGNASWKDPVLGPQTGSYYEQYTWPNGALTQSVIWPEAAANSRVQTVADPSIPIPTMPGSYAFLRGVGSADAFGDAEAYVSVNAEFECNESWDAKLSTLGLGLIHLEGPTGTVLAHLTGGQSFSASLPPGKYRISAGVSAINDGGSFSFLVPSPGVGAILVASCFRVTSRRR